MAKLIAAQTKLQNVQLFDPLSIFDIQKNFK